MTEREARRIEERAFRRGFSHAAYFASVAQSEGKDLQQWADEALEWRSAFDTKRPSKWAAAGCIPPRPDTGERP